MRAKLRATEASSVAVQTANSLVSSELNTLGWPSPSVLQGEPPTSTADTTTSRARNSKAIPSLHYVTGSLDDSFCLSGIALGHQA